MFDDDRSYYQHRIKAEVRRAELAKVPCAAVAHAQLAKAYMEKLASPARGEIDPS